MPTENNLPSRDERLVTIPMWIIEAVRAEVRLEIYVWAEMARYVDRALAQGEQALSCDVKLPPATVFLKGTKVSTLMLGIQQRQHLCALFREFEKPQ